MKIEPAAALVGHIAVPGDKSISHRALMIGGVGDGETLIRRFGRSGDTIDSITTERAQELLAERRARGPAKKRGRAKK